MCYALGITEVDRRSRRCSSSVSFQRSATSRRTSTSTSSTSAARRSSVHLRKYGRRRAALRPRSSAIAAARCATPAKALGIDLDRIDALGPPRWPGGTSATSIGPFCRRRPRSPTRASRNGWLPSSCAASAPPLAARRRLRHQPRPPRPAGADRERGDGGRSVIQWDKDDIDALGLMKVDVLALGMLTAIRARARLPSRARRPRLRCRTSRARTGHLRHDRPRRHRRRLPDRIARADGHAAAPETEACFTTSSSRWPSCRPGPDPGRHGASLPAPASGRRTGFDYPSDAVKGVSAHARRADLPGTGDAARRRRRRLHPGEADHLRRSMAPGSARAASATCATADQRHDRAWLRWDSPAPSSRQIEGFGEYGFPGIARRQLRPARLPLGLAQAPQNPPPSSSACSTRNRWILGIAAGPGRPPPSRRLAPDVQHSNWERRSMTPTTPPCASACIHPGIEFRSRPARRRLGAHMTSPPSPAAPTSRATTSNDSPPPAPLALARRPSPPGCLVGQRRTDPARPAARSTSIVKPPAAPAPAKAKTSSPTQRTQPHARATRWPAAADARRQSALTAATLRLEHNRPARCAGIVTCRQRPAVPPARHLPDHRDRTRLVNIIVRPPRRTPAPGTARCPPARRPRYATNAKEKSCACSPSG